MAGPVDAAATFARRDGWVSDWNDEGQAAVLKGIGADLIRGHGRRPGRGASRWRPRTARWSR